MKIYLTSEQFVSLFWALMDRKMNSIHTNTASQCDRILWSLFEVYEKDVKATLKDAMWGIEDFNSERPSELIGYQFHKSFRQVDVIPTKHIDQIIWMCLQDAPVFWKCMDKACMILANEKAAELYDDEVW